MASDGEKRAAEEIELSEDQVDAWLASRGQKRVQTEPAAEPEAADADADGDVEVEDAPADEGKPELPRTKSVVADRTRSKREPQYAGLGECQLKGWGAPAGAELAPSESAEEKLARIESEAEALRVALDERAKAKAAAAEAAEAEANAGGASDSDPEDEDVAEEYEDADGAEPEPEEPAFEPIADGGNVAVAYGSIFSKNKRRWFAATVVTYDEKKKKYIVKWKSVPKGGRATFVADSGRVRAIDQELYDQAPEDGASFIGFRRQSTWVGQDDQEQFSLKTGDPVAVAYGGQKTVNGTSGKYLWYTARIVGVSDDKYTVQWKFPASKDRAQFEADKDKVQAITEGEFRKSTRHRGKKVVYGFIGYRRLSSAANLSTISGAKEE